MNTITKFQKKGLSKTEIMLTVEQLKQQDAQWESGKLYGFVYHPGDETHDFTNKIYHEFSHTNTLNPFAFKSLRKFENDITGMAAELLNGDAKVAGNVTSGGTESILMAVKSARDWNREKRPDILQPELILPKSAHPAFLKACHYLDVKPVIIPLDKDMRADIKEVRNAINQNTILIAGSAPSFPHGVVDSIEEMARIAADNKLLMHVDACLGGFELPFLKELGYSIPNFDFSIPGVTSISLDTHKYGYGPKGMSIILYRNKELRKPQFFTYPDWPGGLFASSVLSGTRGGGILAATWATMNLLGKEGYTTIVKKVIAESKKIIDGISAIEGLKIIGKPVMSVVAFTSDAGDIFNIGDLMETKGWHLNRLQFPDGLQMTISLGNTGKADEFLHDLEAVTKDKSRLKKLKRSSDLTVKMTKGLSKVLPSGLFKKMVNHSTQKGFTSDAGEKSDQAAFYGLAAKLNDRQNVNEFLINLLDGIY